MKRPWRNIEKCAEKQRSNNDVAVYRRLRHPIGQGVKLAPDKVKDKLRVQEKRFSPWYSPIYH